MNIVAIIGRLTRDPEVRYTENASARANFTVAVDGPQRTGGDGKQEKQVDFIPCVAFGKQAEFIERWFAKGKPIAVQGRLSVRQYEDKDGQKKTYTNVIAERVEFAGDKGEKRDGGQTHGTAQETFDGFQTLDEDLPF